MGFPVKLFTIKGNLVFMNNFYHKVAVASICTALSFTLVTNKEAKAATITLIGNGYSAVDSNRDGRGDFSQASLANFVKREPFAEFRALYEFNIANFSLTSNTIITQAIFQVRANAVTVRERSFWLDFFGYRGNGKGDASNFESGRYLGLYFITQTPIFDSQASQIFTFDVTRFVNEQVSRNAAFAGLSIRPSSQFGETTLNEANLIITTVDVTEPVPEPTTILSAAIALGWGGWLKGKNSIKQNKTKSQD
jgi:hypothetical protein